MTSSVCSSCNRRVSGVNDLALCYDCEVALSPRPLGAEQRPRAPCVRCHGVEIIRALPRTPQAKPLGATLEVETKDEGILGTSRIEISGVRSLGQLETYICRKCGFVEWYCVAPEAVPIGASHNTELLDVSTGGPYR